MARVLIIDDDISFRDTLAETISSLGHEVSVADGAADGLTSLRRQPPDVVFLDYRMPGMNGLEALTEIRKAGAGGPAVIMLTAHASGNNTIEAMKLGAFDHLMKPIGRDEIRAVLARALPPTELLAAPRESSHTADDLIGQSSAMRQVHKLLGMAAGSHAPIMILGETGTGKEKVARALHRHSARSQGPFVAINCAAIPHDLLESELFGHLKGAFTGAVTDRPGCFRAADGGVLLLDEIGDMALEVQAKILRILQEGEVTPLGSHRAVKVDVRVIAATHHDIPSAVREGSFREDLMYRLNVLTIRIPPLRERLADIVLLAEHFLQEAAAPGTPKALTADAAQRLLNHAWPGNVRELKNVMDRCHTMVRHSAIGAADLESAWGGANPIAVDAPLARTWLDSDLPTAVARLERLLITHALEQTAGNRTECAKRLGIHRQLLYRKLKDLGLES